MRAAWCSICLRCACSCRKPRRRVRPRCRRLSRRPIVRCARRWIASSCACGCRVWPLPPRISKIATAGLRCARSSTNSSSRPVQEPPELRAGVVRLRRHDRRRSAACALGRTRNRAARCGYAVGHQRAPSRHDDRARRNRERLTRPLSRRAAQSAHRSFGVADRRISSRVDDERESLARRIAGRRPRSVARGRASGRRVTDSPFILAGIIVVIVAIVLGIAATIIRTRSENSYSIPKSARAYEPDDEVARTRRSIEARRVDVDAGRRRTRTASKISNRSRPSRRKPLLSTCRNAWKTIRCRIFGRVSSRPKTASWTCRIDWIWSRVSKWSARSGASTPWSRRRAKNRIRKSTPPFARR